MFERIHPLMPGRVSGHWLTLCAATAPLAMFRASATQAERGLGVANAIFIYPAID
ncbi:MAG: hypothetical protein KDI82_00585 [Gammaproteobacteria bacterium]|nr:hypothetical protein [Gammaproteobacteria bacterium]